MENQSLISIDTQPESLTTAPSSLTASQKALIRMLDLTANLFSRTLTRAEVTFWRATLSCYEPWEIEAAFQKHLASSVYFPKPADILKAIQLAATLRQMDEQAKWLTSPEGQEAVRRQKEEREERKAQAEAQRREAEMRVQAAQQEHERRRNAGELYGWADVLKLFYAKVTGELLMDAAERDRGSENELL